RLDRGDRARRTHSSQKTGFAGTTRRLETHQRALTIDLGGGTGVLPSQTHPFARGATTRVASRAGESIRGRRSTSPASRGWPAADYFVSAVGGGSAREAVIST